MENPVDDNINVSRSGRKIKIKSYDDYETDYSFIQASNKRKSQSDNSTLWKITAEVRFKSNQRVKEDDHSITCKVNDDSDQTDCRNSTTAMFMCPMCSEEDEDIANIQNHIKQKHDQGQLPLKSKRACPVFSCGICQLTFSSRKAAMTHMTKSHLKQHQADIDLKKQVHTIKDLIKSTNTTNIVQEQSKTDKTIDEIKSKNRDTCDFDVLNENLAIDESSAKNKSENLEKDKAYGPIVIKSARVIHKVNLDESKGKEETDLNRVKNQSSESDLSDLEDDMEDIIEDIGDDFEANETLYDTETKPNKEDRDKTYINQKPVCRLDFSKITHVKYICCFDYCGSVIHSYNSWKKHILAHLDNKKNEYNYPPFQCIECGYSSRLKPVFIQHLLVKHSLLGHVEVNLEHCQIQDKNSSEPVKIITCAFCGLTMDSRLYSPQHKCQRKKVHFYCPFCEKKHSRFEHIQEHIKGEHSDKTVHRKVLGKKFQSLRTAQHDPAYSINNTDTICSTCKQEFKTNDDLKSHANENHATGPFSCGVCRQCYGRQSAVKEHMKKTHSLPLGCKYCMRGFGDKADLARHETSHLKTKPFKCDFCPARFSDQKGLSAHYRFKHTHLEKRAFENSGTQLKEDVFICEICGETLHTQLQYRNHAKSHEAINLDSVAQLKCEICLKKFTSRKIYCRHLCTKALDTKSTYTFKGQFDSVQSVRDIFEQVRKNPPPGTDAVVQCGLCQKNFTKNKYLYNHIRHIHLPNEGKRNQCIICGAGFARKSLLQCHMRSHTKTKPYLCKICGKRFRQLGHVKDHLLSHSAKSLFKCELCPQVFKLRSTLKKHIDKHCEINPYKCIVASCDRSFVTLNNLLLHVRNCDANLLPDKFFECKLCSNVKLEDLKTGLAHMKSHSKDAVYICSICTQDFITYRALYEHKAKLKHFSQSEKEYASNQTIHSQNFKSVEVDDDMDIAKLQQQYEFTPEPFDSQEQNEEQNLELDDDTVAEGEKEEKIIGTEELMDIAEQLTHMAERNVMNTENLEVKTYANDGNCIVEPVETVIEDYNGELFAAPDVDISIQSSKYSNPYNPYNSVLNEYDNTNMVTTGLIHVQNNTHNRKNNNYEAPDLNFSQKDSRNSDIQNNNDNFIVKDECHFEVLASHPVIDESAVLVSKIFQQKKLVTDALNAENGNGEVKIVDMKAETEKCGDDITEFNTENGREHEKMIATCAEVTDEAQEGRDTICIEMLSIPTIYDELGREVKVNVINEEGHEIPIQNNPELLQALLTTGNYSLGNHLSSSVTNDFTKNTESTVKERKDVITHSNNLQQTTSKTELENLDFSFEKTGNAEIYVINEVQSTDNKIQFDASNKILNSSRREKKQKQSIASSDRNIDNVPGEITDKDATTGKSKAGEGNINYKVRLNFYEDRTKNEDVYRLKCDQCLRRFSRLKDLNHHKKIHLPNEEKKFKCKQCGKGYISRKTLFSHMLIHSGDKPHKCNQCEKSFRQLGHLQTHLRIHKNYKPFKCVNCEKTFATNSQLKVHVKKHGMHLNQSIDNCVVCQTCGDGFPNEKHLRVHKVKHISVEAQNDLIKNYNAVEEKNKKTSKEKSFNEQHICDVCGRLFSTLTTLKYHKEMHLSESKLKCDDCGSEFLTKKRLQVHKYQVHSFVQRWQCDVCGQSFKLRTSLNTHIRNLHKDPKFKCTKCHQEFGRRYMFVQHLPLCIGDEILQQGE